MTVPLTAKPEYGNWAQYEYVACVKAGIGFSGHGEWWHYLIDGRCVSLYRHRWDSAFTERVDHPFAPALDWIGQCASAAAKQQQGVGG